MQKNEKGPLRHRKIKCSFLDYVQLLMIGQAIQAKNVDQTMKKQKSLPKLSKIKCSFLDYVQLLMIGQAIQAKNIDQKRPPVIGKQNVQKLLMKKDQNPPKSSKNKMFIFGSCSTSDDQPSDLRSQNNIDRNTKKGLLNHQKIKCSFLDYVQLLMISRVI